MKKTTSEKVIHVPCPHCSNTRLFDCKEFAEGIIEIKCHHCKSIVKIDLQRINHKRREQKLKAYQKIKLELHSED